MGCLKLTYNQQGTPLKVVYRKTEPQQKGVQRFLSVDPMSDDYPQQSPFSYCGWRPINVIDPNGMDEWELNKKGQVNWVKKSDEHTLFVIDKKGKRTGESLTIDNRKIFDDLATVKNKVKQEDAEGNVMRRGEFRMAEVGEKDQKDIAQTFKFLAEKTNVEWGFAIGKENGEIKYKIGTYTLDDISPSLFNNKTIIYGIHSHPGTGDMADEKASMYGDRKQYTSYTRYVYMPNSKNLYSVKDGKSNFKGVIKDYKQFLNLKK